MRSSSPVCGRRESNIIVLPASVLTVVLQPYVAVHLGAVVAPKFYGVDLAFSTFQLS